MKTKKLESFFVLFDYAVANSVCTVCLNRCLKNQDSEVLKDCGEVLDVTPNAATDSFAQYCDFCEVDIKNS